MSRSGHVLVIALVLLAVCTTNSSCNDSGRQPGVDSPAQVVTGGQAAFPALSDLPRDIAAIDGYSRRGNEIVEGFPQNLVTAGLADMCFLPTGSSQLAEMAYAGYCFNHLEAEGAQQLQFQWSSPPPISTESPCFWVGLSNWELEQWQWFTPTSSTALPIDSIEPFIQAVSGNVYVILVILGPCEVVLDEIGFPGLVEPDLGPRVEYLHRIAGKPGEVIQFIAKVHSLNPHTQSWDFGGGADPNISSQRYPEVTLGAEGVYDCNITVTSDDGSDSYDFKLHVTDDLYFVSGWCGWDWDEDGSYFMLSSESGDLNSQLDKDGMFTVINLPNGSYTATPIASGDWVPDHIDFTIDNNYVTDLHFYRMNSATYHSIVGFIWTTGGSSTSIDVNLTGDATKTSHSGPLFSDLLDGNYRVTPNDPERYFVPEYRDLTILGCNQRNVNFLTSFNPISKYKMSGRVTVDGGPAEGILIKHKHVWTEYTTTDASGYYEFNAVPTCPGSATVFPLVCLEAATFVPNCPIGGVMDSDYPNLNFVMTLED